MGRRVRNCAERSHGQKQGEALHRVRRLLRRLGMTKEPEAARKFLLNARRRQRATMARGNHGFVSPGSPPDWSELARDGQRLEVPDRSDRVQACSYVNAAARIHDLRVRRASRCDLCMRRIRNRAVCPFPGHQLLDDTFLLFAIQIRLQIFGRFSGPSPRSGTNPIARPFPTAA